MEPISSRIRSRKTSPSINMITSAESASDSDKPSGGEREESSKSSESENDDVFDSYVLERFRWHPGFPKDVEAKARYEKYVYLKIGNKKIPYGEFRKSFSSLYKCNVLGWFLLNDWDRFPEIVAKDKYKELTNRQKKKYSQLCRGFPLDAEDDTLLHAYLYLQKARLWEGISRGSIATTEPKPLSYENVFSENELRKYSNHPGFPRDPERLATYEKFVFPPLEEEDELIFKTNEEFRKDHGKAHDFYVREWFGNGTWNRYPNIASAEEIESFCSEDKECLKSYLQEDLYDMEDPDLASQYRAIRCHWYARYRPMWYKERNLPLPDLDFHLF